MVLCETGREKKCQREALDILQYYLHRHNHRPSSSSNSSSSSDHVVTNDSIQDGCNTTKSTTTAVSNTNLSLEDEIAMLRKGISADDILNMSHGKTSKELSVGGAGAEYEKKAPSPPSFRVYDTGCRGSVFIMCTRANCELVNTTISTAKHLHDDKDDVHEKKDNHSYDFKEQECLKDPCDVGEKKRKYTQKDTCHDEPHKKQKQDKKNTSKKKNDNDDDDKWDPIETVKAIFQDVREKNKFAPRSRFVTRIIPIQVTCFASLDEMKANMRELIRKYLLPIGIQQYVEQKEKNGSTMTTTTTKTHFPTFKIEFKRRNCSHIHREEVVNATASVIQMLTKEYWTKNHDDDNNNNQAQGTIQQDSNPSLFRVDLTDPQYTILIEICRTLCGMSIVENIKSYRNFNLLVVQDQVGESCEP